MRGDSRVIGAVNQSRMTNGESEKSRPISRGVSGGQSRRTQDVHRNGEQQHEGEVRRPCITSRKFRAYKEKALRIRRASTI